MAQSFSWAVPAQHDVDPSPPKRPSDKPILSLAPAVETPPSLVWSELAPAPEEISWPEPTAVPIADDSAETVFEDVPVTVVADLVDPTDITDAPDTADTVDADAVEVPDAPDTAVADELAETQLFDQEAPDHTESTAFASGVAAAFTVTRSALAVAQVRDDVACLVSVNPAFCALTGCDAETVLGGDPLPMRSPDCDPAALEQLTDAITDGLTVTAPLLCRRTDGTAYWAEITVSPVGVLLIIEQQDLTRQLEAEADEWRARHVDPVTGSAARALADEAIAGYVHSNQPFGLLLVRVFGVQQCNREGGYEAGDAALAATADRLTVALAGRGRVARHVGTQFVVIVDNLGADGRGLTHDLADELEIAASQDGLHAYAGTALFPVDANSSSELLDVARSQFETVRRQSRTALGRLTWRVQWMLSQR